MPVPPLPLPSGLPEAFSCRDARAAGASARRLRAKDLRRPFRGVRQQWSQSDLPDDSEPLARDRRAHLTVRRTATAYATIMHPDARFVGLTAVALLELPLPWSFDPTGPLHVAATPPHRAPRGAGIVGHKYSTAHVSTRVHRGLPTAAPADLWASLAGTLDDRELIILGDAIVCVPRDHYGTPRPEHQLATIAQLEEAALRPGRRGRTKLLRTLERVRVGSMSALETDFRLAAEDAGLPEPELDVEIMDATGYRVGIADQLHRRWSVVVEIEGQHHRTSATQWDRDLDKQAAYAAAGLELVRLSASHVRGSRPRGPALVRAALERHGWRTDGAAGDHEEGSPDAASRGARRHHATPTPGNPR